MIDQDELTYVHRLQHVPKELDAGTIEANWERVVEGLAELGVGVDSSSRLHLLGQNRFRYLNSLVSATQSADQTGIVVNLWTALLFGAELFDTDTIHSTSSNTSRLTLPIIGKWLVFGACYVDYSGITTPLQLGMRFHLNGLGAGSNDIFGYNLADAIGSTTGGIASSAIISTATITDYVECAAIVVGSAGTWDAINIYTGLTNFGAVYIGE